MGTRRLAVLLISTVAGGSTLVLELISVRALAPFFGSSVEVWTSAIGVVLLALSAGYGAGGVFAERFNPRRLLGMCLTLAGALVVLTPFALPRIAKLFLPDDLGLDQSSVILRSGAFFTQGALFGLPVFFAAFTNPLLIRLLCDDGMPPGRASGAILWTSTLGGLTGTFATTYALVPNAGVRATLFGTGMVLALLGMAALWGDRRRAQVLTLAVAAVAPAGTLGFVAQSGPVKPQTGSFAVLAERQTREQYLRVVENSYVNAEGAQESERWLQVNEGLDSFQSLDAPGRRTPGHYYDMLAFAALLCGEVDSPSVLLVGAGAGSTARSLLEMAPAARVEGIELDPGVADLGREFLRMGELESRGFRMHAGIDGRRGVARSKDTYDAILIDAYARQVEIPFHLVTREMFELCFRKLSPHGVLAINVSSFADDDPILTAVAATLESANSGGTASRPAVHLLRVRRDHNVIALARKDGMIPPRVKMLDTLRGKPDVRPVLRAIAQYALSPGVLFEYRRDPSAVSLTDDWAPVEYLQAESLRRASASWN